MFLREEEQEEEKNYPLNSPVKVLKKYA